VKPRERRLNQALARLVTAQICVHAAMAGMRMAAPLLALQQGYSAAAVGVLLALFALTQVFLALPAGAWPTAHGLHRPLALAWPRPAGLGAGGGLAACSGPVPGGAVHGRCRRGGVIALQRHVGRLADGATALKKVFSWSHGAGGVQLHRAVQRRPDDRPFRLPRRLRADGPAARAGLVVVTHGAELPPVALRPSTSGACLGLLREPHFRRLLLVNWLQSACWDVHTFVLPCWAMSGPERLGHRHAAGRFAVAAAAIRLRCRWWPSGCANGR
jgi:hypothetical protein